MQLVHWPLMGGLLHVVQQGGTGQGHSPPRPLLAVPNVTAHPSMTSVPVTVLLYNGPLNCVVTPTSSLTLCVCDIIVLCCVYSRHCSIFKVFSRSFCYWYALVPTCDF